MTCAADGEGHRVIARGSPGDVEYLVSYGDAEAVALSPVTLLNTFLRHRRLVVAWILVCSVGAGLLTALLRGYEAESSFAPGANQPSISSLAGLASQFGVNVGSLTGGPSLAFYAAVANSRATLTVAANGAYAFRTRLVGGDSVQGALGDLLGVSGRTPLERLQRTVRKLDHMVRVTKDEDAGIVTITVTAKWPGLAEQINRQLLSLVNQVNLEQHQAEAAAERSFALERLQEVRSQLDSAEDALQRFLETNRTYQESPRLTAQQGRLQRRVEFLQQVYLTLAQTSEHATIEEARNTPVITVIDVPEGSAKKAGSLALSVVVGMLLGALFGAVHGIGKDYMTSQRAADSSTYSEFVSLQTAAVEDLMRLPRRLLKAVSFWRRVPPP